MREPRKITKDVRKLAEKMREDADFASLVFDIREVMEECGASHNHMRAALRLVLHQDTWAKYRRELAEKPPEEAQDVEAYEEYEDGYEDDSTEA